MFTITYLTKGKKLNSHCCSNYCSLATNLILFPTHWTILYKKLPLMSTNDQYICIICFNNALKLLNIATKRNIYLSLSY